MIEHRRLIRHHHLRSGADQLEDIGQLPVKRVKRNAVIIVRAADHIIKRRLRKLPDGRALRPDRSVGGELPAALFRVIPQLDDGAVHLLLHPGMRPVDGIGIALRVVAELAERPADHLQPLRIQNDSARLLHHRISEVTVIVVIEDRVGIFPFRFDAVFLQQQALPRLGMLRKKPAEMRIRIHLLSPQCAALSA